MDRTRLDALLEEHLDALFAFLALRVAPDRDLARDLCQEVLRAALAGAGRLRDPAATRAWLFGIARNRLAEHLRARGPRLVRVADEGDLVPDAAGEEEEDRRARALRVAAVLRELPSAHAELLEAKYLEGASVRALAARTGRSEKAVESALARAREAFRAAWAATDEPLESTA